MEFTARLEARRKAFDAVFWNESAGLWLDWDRDSGSHLEGFYASSLVPLLWGCSKPNLTRHERVLSSLTKLGVLDYPGGIPASLHKSFTQQWDFPNAWAPLQWFAVVGWYNSEKDSLRDTARSIATNWIQSTYRGWEENKTMYEKVSYIWTASSDGRSFLRLLPLPLSPFSFSSLSSLQYDCREVGVPGSGGEYTIQVCTHYKFGFII